MFPKTLQNIIPFAITCGVVACLSLCRCSGETTQNAFGVDSLVFERNCALANPLDNDPLGGRSRFKAVVDYPVSGSENTANLILTDSVKRWISKRLLPNAEPVMSRSVLDRAANSFLSENTENELGEELSVTIKKVYEDDKYISYEYDRYFYSGDSRSALNVFGATFEKQTGKRLSWADFHADDTLRSKITTEIRKTRKSMSDDQLASLLIVSRDSIILPDGSLAFPIPKADPWKSNLGWVFTYQPSEILPAKQGAPGCFLSENDVKFK